MPRSSFSKGLSAELPVLWLADCLLLLAHALRACLFFLAEVSLLCGWSETISNSSWDLVLLETAPSQWLNGSDIRPCPLSLNTWFLQRALLALELFIWLIKDLSGMNLGPTISPPESDFSFLFTWVYSLTNQMHP